jgi:hypothetical protein
LACSPGILAGIQFRGYPTKVQSHPRFFVPHQPAPNSGSSSSGPRKGWKEIAGFLGLPVFGGATLGEIGHVNRPRGAERAGVGGRTQSRMERETSEPVPIATEAADSSAELRRGLWYGKKQKQARNQKNVA